MKKSYKLEELDCAHCAALIEGDVAKLDGVDSAAVNLMSQKMVIECEDSKLTDIHKSIIKIVKKYEPDVDVIEL